MSQCSVDEPPQRCELCDRATGDLTRHHLIPRTRHSNRRNKRDFDRKDVRTRIAMLCRACHKQVHASLSEKELERYYNTLAALRAHPDIGRFVKWVRKQAPGAHVTVRSGEGKARG